MKLLKERTGKKVEMHKIGAQRDGRKSWYCVEREGEGEGEGESEERGR